MMESIWATQSMRLAEDRQRGEVADGTFGVYMRHALAIVLHLVFVVSLSLSLCWKRCRVCTPRPESYVLKHDYSKKLHFGVIHKVTMFSCVSLSVLYGMLGIWSPLNWWLKEKPKDFGAEAEYVVQAIAWAIISAYAYYSLTKKTKEKLPFLLQMWLILSLILYGFFLFLNILGFKEQKRITFSIVVEVLALFLSAFLCYASCCGTTGEGPLPQSIQEPLLSDLPDNSENLKPKVTPYATASFLSRVSFSWMKPLLDVGNNKPLDIDDVPQVADIHKAEQAYDNFRIQLDTKVSGFSIAKRLFLIVLKDVFFTALLAALNTCSSYVGPYFIDNFIQCIAGKGEFASEGIVLACAFLFAQVVESLSTRHYIFRTIQMGICVKAALTAAIYKKGLMLSSQSRQKHTSGEIINYMSVDTPQIGDFCWCVNDIWNAPLQVLLALIILYQNLGLASLAGVVATVLVMMANFPLGKMQEKYNTNLMEEKDKRMKATSEILRNMRVLKLQAWETTFLLKLETLRREECNWLKKYFYTRAGSTFVFWAAPIFVSVVTFGTCKILGVPLTTGKILSTLATFKILQEPINNLPDLISMIAQTKVSLDRIASFLQQEELQQDAVEEVSKDLSDIAIEIQEGVFSWDPAAPSPTIRGLDVQIKKGMRVAVCGTVGSGKSSFLSCILGEIPKISGTVKISGTKAYVSQSPWIPSGKIKDNILFGKEWEKTRYESVLQACAFKKDLELFPYGDQTEIGERGINLSGGQKQRIQIARALYQDADVYLFDDPFSAVDAHTGTHIFQECLLGMLGSKTVVYVTHQVEFLFAADLILVIRDGKITQAGKYDDILQSNTDFDELVGAHQKALKTINAMENSDILSSQVLIEGLCTDNGTNAKDVNHEQLQKQGSVHKSEEVEEEIESKNHSKKEIDQKGRSSQLVQEEEREKGRVSMWVYWDYITAAYKGALVPIILLVHTVFQLLEIGSNYWMAWATPLTEDQRPPVSSSLLILVYVALAVCSSLCILVRTTLLCLAGYKCAKQLFSNMHSCIFRAPMSFFDATPTGRILNRASTDQSKVDQVIPFKLGSLAFSLIRLLGTIAVMSQVAWQVFIIFIPVLAICIWYQQYFIGTSRELARLIGVCRAPIIQHFSESISGAATIRSFDQEFRFMNRNLQLIDGFSKQSFHNSGAMEWLAFRMDLFSNLVFAFSMVVLLCLPESVVNPSIAGLGITYGLSLNMAQTVVIWDICSVENNMICVERMVQYSRIPSEPPLIIENSRPSSSWPSRGTIDIIDLQVRYGPHLPLVLKGLTCTFPGGTKVGIVGRTGCGKSTLIQSLFRIVDPSGGRIVMDGIDILTIGLRDLRSKLSIIPQDPTMFEGTIRNNLDPLGDHSDEEIWEALDKCQLEEVVRAKEEKLDSLVTENGENWSVGQRQLVCLGRVLLKQSRILVLDEATASVDTATDRLIQQTIQNQFYDSTVITIAHRIPSVCDSDLVLVLSDGKIAEYDSPIKLLENKSSAFAKLVSEYTMRSTNGDGI
ncbi:putative ABC transporter C family member 15 isoform X1 [Cryptomeria japonica]|uniref:putative ABC transporter C family member 15 isoform X1 n=1 Tax=Cryptomeria japonica TaxID=3369 RepID=UPI0027D9D5DC|nr:putative ABC transporter C family member 15 isoform X1 [Cryptomeria japonica]XP_057820878.2 putative ABC transporter C family member 15 isoform X1 [Cryptomeria japonica]